MMKPLHFKCTECNEVLHKRFDFLEHQNVHTGETPFMCKKCKQSFGFIKEYVSHIKTQNCHQIPEVESVCELKGLLKKTRQFEINNKTSETNEFITSLVEPTVINLEENLHLSESPKIEHLQKRDKNIFNSLLKTKNSNMGAKSKTMFNKYYCSVCQIDFNLLKSYEIHKREFHNFICENCKKKFPTNEKLAKHACPFMSLVEKCFKCSCSQTFVNTAAFKCHIGKKPFSCCSCSMQFNSITNLIRHIRTHTKQKPFICKHCGRGFSQSANLKNHSSVHLGIRAIKCNECSFSCKTFNGLLKHKKKHKEGFINQQNYVDGRKKSTDTSCCPICNKQFLFKRNMGMHMKIHSNKVLLCNECGKVFESKGKLTSHYKACHREPSVCKICGKIFASAVLLCAHEKTHVSVKSFSCIVCHKTFSIKNYLVQHMKTHSNKKQFSCSKCGKLFKVAVSLKYHNNICTSSNIPV